MVYGIAGERWQDPHSAPSVTGLLEENPAAPNDKCMHFDKLLHFGSRSPHRKGSRVFCAAKRFNRADIAFRLTYDANELAKIEKCRVESRGIVFWTKTRRVLPKLLSAGVGID